MYISNVMKPKIQITGEAVTHTWDLRDLLNDDEGRAAIASQLAAHLEYRVIRMDTGLGILIRDTRTGTVLDAIDLNETLAKSLTEGSLIKNAIDQLAPEEALNITADIFAGMAEQLRIAAEFSGASEGDFVDATLPVRPIEVEQEAAAVMETAG